MPESDCRLAAVLAAEHSTRCACRFVDSLAGTGRVVYSRRKVSQESFDRARISKKVDDPATISHRANSILANVLRALKSFAAIFLAPFFEMGLGKTRSSKLSFQTLLDALAGIDKTFNQSKQFSYDIDYKEGTRGRKISISFRLTKVTIYVNRDV